MMMSNRRLTLAFSGTVEAEAWVQDAISRHTTVNVLDLRRVRAEALSMTEWRGVETLRPSLTDAYEEVCLDGADCCTTVVAGPRYVQVDSEDQWTLVLVLDSVSPAPLELMDITRDVQLNVRAVFTDESNCENNQFGIEYFAGTARILDSVGCMAVLRAAGQVADRV